MDKIALGKRIRQARLLKEIRRGEFAAELGVSYTMVGHYEAGRNMPSVDRLIQIASLVGRPLNWIVGIDEDALRSPQRGPDEVSPRGRKKTPQKRSSRRRGAISTDGDASDGVVRVPSF